MKILFPKKRIQLQNENFIIKKVFSEIHIQFLSLVIVKIEKEKKNPPKKSMKD